MVTTSSSSTLECLQAAHADLYNLTFSYLKPMALQCAVNLKIPSAIHSCGGSASLADLLAILPIPERREPYLIRLMRFLAAIGIVATLNDDAPSPSSDGAATAAAAVEARVVYRLTTVSRLLVDDDAAVAAANGCTTTNLSPFVLSQITKHHLTASMHLSQWFVDEGVSDDDDDKAIMPFKMAYGTDLWGFFQRDPQANEVFNNGLASDCQVVMDFVVTRCGEVFDGVNSLVDVGGGTGRAARIIAKAFPHIKCSVLDLACVISTIQQTPAAAADDEAIVVEYIAGDMMDSIPPTDVVLLKYVLHDWNDEECVKILTQCKKAICSGNNPTRGKVVIIDTIVGSPSNKAMCQVQVSLDLLMMVMTSGKERDEHEWHKIFTDAGFGHYKARPVMGFLSIIELYPSPEMPLVLTDS